MGEGEGGGWVGNGRRDLEHSSAFSFPGLRRGLWEPIGDTSTLRSRFVAAYLFAGILRGVCFGNISAMAARVDMVCVTLGCCVLDVCGMMCCVCCV